MTNYAHQLKRVALIIDDDSTYMNVYKVAMTHLGFDCCIFDKEDDALKYLQTESPHIAIVHFSESMRRSTDFISQIHSKDPSICIFYITAYTGESVRLRAIQSGAYMVLNKQSLDLFSDQFTESIKRAFEKSAYLKQNFSKNSEVFVLMPFAKEFDEIYRLAIQEPLEKLGFTCQRVDEIQFIGKIIDQVCCKIQQAQFIVADMTGKNPNVFYEVGYAHAIGKTVILLTQNVDDIPFDLRAEKHIVYDASMLKLRDELTKAVKTLNES